MFTGLVEEIGTIRQLQRKAGSTDIRIGCSQVLEGLQTGDSIAVNGVCLTVTGFDDTSYSATAAPETLSRTNLGALEEGSQVNLERSLTLQTRLGGHLVQGHVDGIATAISMVEEGDSQRWSFSMPADLAKFLVFKGSIAINGVSLTIASLDNDQFSVALIPKTIEATTFRYLQVGQTVNIETDLIGKYVHRLMELKHNA